MRIQGKSSSGEIDFDVKVNMMNLIVPEEDRKGRMNYVKIIGNGGDGISGRGKGEYRTDADGGFGGVGPGLLRGCIGH